MKVYSGNKQIEEQLNNWLIKFPLHLLKYISLNSFPTRGVIIRFFRRSIPEHYQGVIDHIPYLLEWFEERGDIIIGKNGVISTYPSYVLKGDKIENGIPIFGRFIEEETMDYYIKNEYIYQGDTCYGIDRRLLFKTNVNEQPYEDILKIYNISSINVESFLTLTKSINDLQTNSINETQIWPMGLNGWYNYCFTSNSRIQAYKWGKTDEWNDEYILLKTHSDSDDGLIEKRYFINLGAKRLEEISKNKAIWWQYKLDKQYNTSIRFNYYHNLKQLKINSFIPLEVHQYLKFLSFRPFEKIGFNLNYFIEKNQLKIVQAFIQKTLGVYIINH